MSIEAGGEVGGYNRREILKLGAVFGGGVLTAQLGPEITGLPEVKPHYTEGDVIQTPIGDLVVEGWQVQRAIKKTDDPNGLDDFKISIVDEFGSSTYFEKNGGSYVLGRGKSGKFVDALPFYPSPYGDPVTLILNMGSRAVAHANSGNPTVAYSIKPRVFTESQSIEYGFVLSQEPVDLGQLKQVANLREAFQPFVLGLAPIYVFADTTKTVKDEVISGGSQDSRKGVIEMQTSAFTNPLYEGEALGTAFHELSHEFIRHLLENTAAYPSSADIVYGLQGAYKPIAATYKGEYRADTLAGILTESTYIHVPGKPVGSSRAGHPQDNFNEMFASTMTIMRFHTEPFLAAFDKLKDTDKHLIKSFVRATFNALAETGASDKKLQNLLPEAAIIKHRVLGR